MDIYPYINNRIDRLNYKFDNIAIDIHESKSRIIRASNILNNAKTIFNYNILKIAYLHEINTYNNLRYKYYDIIHKYYGNGYHDIPLDIETYNYFNTIDNHSIVIDSYITETLQYIFK
jgi:hypothetical protein